MQASITGHLVDVLSGRIIRNQQIKFDNNGKIVEISTLSDCPNQFLIPGLFDTHVHTVLEPSPDFPAFSENESKELRWQRMRRNVVSSLRAGITTLRDCGHPDSLIYKLRREMNSHPEWGSRVFCCGPSITTPKGHGQELGIEIRGILSMEKACQEIIQDGADFIKLINNDPDGFSVDEIKAAVEVAHRNGKKIACHIYQIKPLRRALAAGVDTIEHFSETDTSGVKSLLSQNIIVSPTLAGAGDGLAHPEANVIGDEDVESLMVEGGFKRWIGQLETGTKMLIKNHVPLATGSDAGFLHTDFKTTLREIIALVELGCSPFEALQAATINSAKTLGVEKDLGSIELGKIADIVVYSENPLSNIKTIFSPIMVFKEGKIPEICQPPQNRF